MLTDEPLYLRLIHCCLHSSCSKKMLPISTISMNLEETRFSTNRNSCSLKEATISFQLCCFQVQLCIYRSGNEECPYQFCRIILEFNTAPAKKHQRRGVVCLPFFLFFYWSLTQKPSSYRDTHKVGCKCWIIQNNEVAFALQPCACCRTSLRCQAVVHYRY